jgi:hypothetical protein
MMFTSEQNPIWMGQVQPGGHFKGPQEVRPIEVDFGQSGGPLKCAKEDIRSKAPWVKILV